MDREINTDEELNLNDEQAGSRQNLNDHCEHRGYRVYTQTTTAGTVQAKAVAAALKIVDLCVGVISVVKTAAIIAIPILVYRLTQVYIDESNRTRRCIRSSVDC